MTRPDKNPDVAELLGQARTLIAEAIAKLDTRARLCTGCSRQTFINWPEAQVEKELAAVVQKLRRFEHLFGTGEDLGDDTVWRNA